MREEGKSERLQRAHLLTLALSPNRPSFTLDVVLGITNDLHNPLERTPQPPPVGFCSSPAPAPTVAPFELSRFSSSFTSLC